MAISYEKGKEKKIKFFVAVSVLAVAVCAIVIISVSFLGASGSAKNNIIVYKNDSGIAIRIGKYNPVALCLPK